jgi:hypothetical protein
MKSLTLIAALFLVACSSSLKPSDVKNAFKSLPIKSVEDMNEGTGRPNGPIEKFAFFDTRYSKMVTVGFYTDNATANQTKTLLDGLGPMADYNFIHKNVLVVIPREFKPEHAEEYRTALTQIR